MLHHGPLTRNTKLRVAHAPGMSGMFSPPPTSKETASQRSRHASRHVHHARAVMHVGIAKPRWRWKRPRHSRCMRNWQFYVSGKRPMMHTHSPFLFIRVYCSVLILHNNKMFASCLYQLPELPLPGVWGLGLVLPRVKRPKKGLNHKLCRR